MQRDRKKMGYWDLQQSKKHSGSPPEKVHCSLCGKQIQFGSPLRLRYGVGILCIECSKKQ
jgi:hypothetical protein